MQAIQLSENEHGDKKNWDSVGVDCNFDEETNSCSEGSVAAMQWYNKYLAKYMSITKLDSYRYNGSGSTKCNLYFTDGSMFSFNQRAGAFYISAADFNKCLDDEKKCLGTKSFTFYFYNANNKGFEPYNSGKNITSLINDSIDGCNHTATNKYVNCTALIQANGWEIPDNYPLKF